MARSESDREDLLAEATALYPRGEWRVPGSAELVTLGLRQTGLSIYFGGDPCYHFDAEGRLRRGFVDGDLYRTQGTTLARLRRVRTGDATELQRVDLAPQQCAEFLRAMQHRLEGFLAACAGGNAVRLRSVPEDESPWPDVIDRLRRCCDNPRLAPALPTRRN